MYEIIKEVIKNRGYALETMLKKIDTLWVQGDLSDEQKTELVAFAQDEAKIENGIDVLNKLTELDKRIKNLEEKATEDISDSAGSKTIDAYVAGQWYYRGNVIEFEGDAYICTAPEGQVCTWSPTQYPLYWRKTAEA